ncbi:glutathione S-transferase family protein [Pelomicrobium methylotrophicum]|uniref:glutathione S-transferase family protein n=1 Tax=Pelomicrobium methylotrophicum TaxID=2602750 RepID=UPI001969B543|nr:glutathione S-transferase [Pelomicrobium methylotrophicum]
MKETVKEVSTRKLYARPQSGNCHKVRLLLGFLKLSYQEIPVDISGGENRREPFISLNPLGQIPVLVEGETVLRDSQAILVYLARKYGGEQWLPSEALPMAQVVQWLSVAANEIQNSLNLARLYYLMNAKVDIDLATRRGHAILNVMNGHLASREWLECGRPTIADLACFPYVALAYQGGISIEDYRHVKAWVERIKALPGFTPMPGM